MAVPLLAHVFFLGFIPAWTAGKLTAWPPARSSLPNRHCRFLSDKLSATTIRGLLTIDGGERISEGDF
jgi:hypothetical protein